MTKGQQIKTELIKQGLKQKKLLELTPYSRKTISAACNDKQTSFEVYKSIEKALNFKLNPE